MSAPAASVRLTVAFDAETGTSYVPFGPNAGKKFGTVTEFVQRDRKTPTGGDYVSRQFTLTLAGAKFYGTCGKKVNQRGWFIVKCRPAKEK